MGIQNVGGSSSSTIAGYEAGTEATRPATAAAGVTRYNTTRNRVEIYSGSSWQSLTAASALPTQSVTYLAVGGGGGAGTNNTDYGGGGGGGGMLEGTLALTQGNVYTITVGAASTARDTNGSNTVISGTGITTVTAYGGGAGGYGWNGSSAGAGASGGNGGGAGGRSGNGAYTTYGGSALNAGGYSGGNTPSYGAGSAGGGGAGSGGGSAPGAGSNTGGNGGAGRSSSITGTATYYAGGGPGYYVWGSGSASNPGTYGVGQSALGSSTYLEKGIVILTYPDAIGDPAVLTGSPTKTTTGTTRVYTFLSSGTIGF